MAYKNTKINDWGIKPEYGRSKQTCAPVTKAKRAGNLCDPCPFQILPTVADKIRQATVCLPRSSKPKLVFPTASPSTLIAQLFLKRPEPADSVDYLLPDVLKFFTKTCISKNLIDCLSTSYTPTYPRFNHSLYHTYQHTHGACSSASNWMKAGSGYPSEQNCPDFKRLSYHRLQQLTIMGF